MFMFIMFITFIIIFVKRQQCLSAEAGKEIQSGEARMSRSALWGIQHTPAVNAVQVSGKHIPKLLLTDGAGIATWELMQKIHFQPKPEQNQCVGINNTHKT